MWVRDLLKVALDSYQCTISLVEGIVRGELSHELLRRANFYYLKLLKPLKHFLQKLHNMNVTLPYWTIFTFAIYSKLKNIQNFPMSMEVL